MITLLEKIVKFCVYQDRSVNETRLKIRSLKISKEDEQQIIDRLLRDHFLDDQRFAENFARGKMDSKGWGIAKIKAGLFQKGIPEQLIQSVISEIDVDQYANNLQKEIAKWNRSNTLNSETKPKLIRFLLSKGYSYELIMKEIDIQ
jgi:regulatory protein